MDFLRRFVGRARMRRVESVAVEYSRVLSRDEVERIQVERFNKVWAYCVGSVSFYGTWAKEHALPPKIDSLAELRTFPQLTKSVLVERASEVFDDGAGGTIPNAYSTGGSTGTPVRFPKGAAEADATYANVYTMRSWWGIRPFDSYVHLWGHAHLFGGKGLSGTVTRLKRQAMDWMVNAARVNAYDMTEPALASHYETILRRNPKYLVGYTSAIFKLARHVESQGKDVSRLSKLRGVVVTAETVTKADVELVSRVFKAPVIIEYGAAETGVMAGSRGGSWPLQVLWRSYIINVSDVNGEMTVTTLEDRVFPLINYAVGDRAEGGDVMNGNALTLGAVVGRKQDVVTVSGVNGERIDLSAILPVHILKSEAGITAVQLRQDTPTSLRIFLAADHELDLVAIASSFVTALRGEHPAFDPSSVALEQVAEPVLTKAGKQALFV